MISARIYLDRGERETFLDMMQRMRAAAEKFDFEHGNTLD